MNVSKWGKEMNKHKRVNSVAVSVAIGIALVSTSISAVATPKAVGFMMPEMSIANSNLFGFLGLPAFKELKSINTWYHANGKRANTVEAGVPALKAEKAKLKAMMQSLEGK